MVGYRWTCNACSAPNEANTSLCAKCGCSATASSDEIDKHLDPEGHNRKQVKEGYEKKLLHLLVSPAFLMIFLFNGRFEFLLLSAVSLTMSIKLNSSLIKHILADSWLKKVALSSSGFLVFLIIARVVLIPRESELANFLIFVPGLILTVTFYALFKSARGKSSFEKYYKQHDS